MKKYYIFFSFRFCLYLTLLGGMGATLLWIIQHQELPIALTNLYLSLIVVAFILVYSFVFSWVPWGTFSSEGVKTLNTLGLPKSIAWSEITNAKVRSIAGWLWLCLYTNNSKFAVWVPVNMRRTKQFREIIQSLPNKEIITNVWNPKT